MQTRTGGKRMQIRLLYFDGCPSYESALAAIRDVVAEQHLEAEIKLVRITTAEEAVMERFLGSPTVQVDGVDIEGLNTEMRQAELSCRLYDEQGSLLGWPSRRLIRTALQAERDQVFTKPVQDVCCTR